MHGESFDSYMLLTPSDETPSELEGIAGSDNTISSYLAHQQQDESSPQSFNTTTPNSSINSNQFLPVSTPMAEPIDIEFHNAGPEFAEIGAIFFGNIDLLRSEDDLSYVPTLSSGIMSFVADSEPFS